MVKMSLDPVRVMTGQVEELKVSPSSNGDSKGPWEEKAEFDQDNLGLTVKPKMVGRSRQNDLWACNFINTSFGLVHLLNIVIHLNPSICSN